MKKHAAPSNGSDHASEIRLPTVTWRGRWGRTLPGGPASHRFDAGRWSRTINPTAMVIGRTKPPVSYRSGVRTRSASTKVAM
jgi:hypothetical protein